MNQVLTPSYLATLACLLEVTAPKPGNVHRSADFEDLTFPQFVVSAVVLGQSLERCHSDGLGRTVLEIVRQTQQVVGTNTNLGMALLLTPLYLAAVKWPKERLSSKRVAEVFVGLDGSDGGLVFEAIRIAGAGGMGEVERLDIGTTAGNVDLLAAMELAAERDSIARGYTDGLQAAFEKGVSLLQVGLKLFGQLDLAIVLAHVAWMASEPDSLIARKCGIEIARQSQALAGQAMDALWEAGQWRQPKSGGGWDLPTESIATERREAFWDAVGELDFWLRSDGHRRNPGTTADWMAASLFVAMFNGDIDQSIVPGYRW